MTKQIDKDRREFIKSRDIQPADKWGSWFGVMKASFAVIAIALLVVVLSAPTPAQNCLEYGPTVTLTGTLQSRVFAGPPNFESIKRGDAKETAIILKLASPSCTKGDDPMGYDVSYSNIREMQLVIYDDDKSKNDEQWKIVDQRSGKRVVVTGTLFGAHSGHHRTNVLIQVSDIRAAH